jgi:hypothetical protein
MNFPAHRLSEEARQVRNQPATRKISIGEAPNSVKCGAEIGYFQESSKRVSGSVRRGENTRKSTEVRLK